MRSWIWLCAIGPAKPDSCSPEVAVSSNLLQRRHHTDRPHLNYGSPGCPCVGFDGLNRTASPDQALVGTHCDNWTRHCMEETCQAWCFVDPCQCNVSSRPTAATEGFAWQGHALFASSETCNLSLAGSERSKSKNGNSSASPVETPSFCRNFDQDNYGNEKCKCIGIEHLTGNVSAEVDGEKVPYPMDVGSHCSRWDDQPVGICSKEDRPSWCGKNWCYVDPCACAISEPPKVSSYFPKVTYGKKPLYYSYETCGSFDTFTFDSRSACVNQETEAKCLGIGADPDDPELRKCAWGGPEIKCLGKELLHFCQVNDQTIQDWTWWSFSRGDVQRGHMGPAVVTAGIYVLILLFFLMVLPDVTSFSRAPVSQNLARSPSTSSDRWQSNQKVSMLQEPVERPLSRYLHKRDGYYNRIVPDWNLQIKTLEQQYLYQGDFALLIKEVTDEGAIVQDVTTGVYGFIPEENLGNLELLPGDTVQGGRCTYVDTTVIQSPDPTMLRMQSGIVFEWDEENGEGFIIPSEDQDAFRMIRVLRRDIKWHDSRRLFPGQFVQFDTALPHEVPVTSPLDPEAPLALRVRGLEIRFSLEEAYEMIPQGSREAMLLEAPPQAALAEASEVDGADEADVEPVPGGASLVPTSALEVQPPRSAYPVVPGRPELQTKKKVHPLLQRFAKQAPEVAEAESPSWMWEPQLEYLKEEVYAPIVPVQLRQMPAKVKRKRILVHEVAHERGDTWQEAAHRKYLKLWDKMKPPGRKETEKISVRYHRAKKAFEDEQVRRQKWTLSAEQKRQRRAARAGNGA